MANLVFDLHISDPVSKAQLDKYGEAFGIAFTQDNVTRMARTICSARASACREATARLPVGDDGVAQRSDKAQVKDAPFAIQQVERMPRPLAVLKRGAIRTDRKAGCRYR